MSRHAWISAIVFSAIMWGLIFLASSCNAETISKERMINACIGEAEGEPYIGKLYIMCAIRNRGTLQGVYGEKSKRVINKKYSKKTYEEAVKAWEESENNKTITADHWGGNICDKKWIAKAKASGKFKDFTIVGNQTFFTKIKR